MKISSFLRYRLHLSALRHAPSCARSSFSALKMLCFALFGRSVWNNEYGALLKSCHPCFLSMIGGTHPAQGAKQTPLFRQVYAEAQRQLPIGDPACDRCWALVRKLPAIGVMAASSGCSSRWRRTSKSVRANMILSEQIHVLAKTSRSFC